ncbi:MAG: UDP-N-acetylmuramate--L-alanine ligase [Armatimonadota bacterium]|nr:UDP-N-acetylmuramate--L-alanine ligase [Armatimonadota bacterium]MDR7451753.1 UDP-N-acetylmuramate--L-alanine ligase [Armatimonadota bacterium]MDR7467378.1 UDP-N-acetylmuramate--L-alanine ligase [Armatimonadota bacterium]MDR7494148.1 UDP-N-acetylmuramate--L-alanine ligase [Armatimonadota bacterium]MDR7498886.1 UDP-N-acetylmuramate--L-alanine ligase [Armatimonadota bacterium]
MIDRQQRVHFVGIGGAGMSAVAHVLLSLGYRVSGSDLRSSEAVGRLEALGATVHIGHDAAHVEGADIVVASRAVPDLNPEIVAARYRGIPVLHRAQVLGQLFTGRFGIAVVGTHGKTTTTAMTAHVLAAGGCDPTALVGADVEGLGGNVRLGAGRHIVAEVDESDGSLLYVRPSAAVVTSLDFTDHRDYYGTVARLTETFTRFLRQLPADGFAVMCSDHPHVRRLVPEVTAPVHTYGLQSRAGYTAEIHSMEGRLTRCTFRRRGRALGGVMLPVPGRYNVRNALAATAVGVEVGLTFDQVARALETFPGVRRRFEVRGEVDGIMVVDDYAHNPIKVAAVLRAARESWPTRRIVAVFQPHRYTRTKTTYRRFSQAFQDADELVITEIYPADEPPIPGVSAALIVDTVRARRPVTFIARLEAVVDYLTPRLRPGDLVLTLGAGDVWKIADRLVAALQAARPYGEGGHEAGEPALAVPPPAAAPEAR